MLSICYNIEQLAIFIPVLPDYSHFQTLRAIRLTNYTCPTLERLRSIYAQFQQAPVIAHAIFSASASILN
jgi:hypothetical protein